MNFRNIVMVSCAILFFEGCSENNISLHPKIYYCAAFEQGGTQLILNYPIKSEDQIKKERKRIPIGYDAYYYKIDGKKIYAYSIKNNRLQELLTRDNHNRLATISNIKSKLSCSQAYHYTSSHLIVDRACNDKTSFKEYYHFNEKLNVYEYEQGLYKVNNHVDHSIKAKNGILYFYDNNGRLKRKTEDIEISDLCAPYILFETTL